MSLPESLTCGRYSRVLGQLKHRSVHKVTFTQFALPLVGVVIHRAKLVKREPTTILSHSPLCKDGRGSGFLFESAAIPQVCSTANHQTYYPPGDVHQSFDREAKDVLRNRGKRHAERSVATVIYIP